jgi:UDP-2,3-diacylglucosamine hydrolase
MQHELGGGRRRIVLSDWDAGAARPRLEVLRLDEAGEHRVSP